MGKKNSSYDKKNKEENKKGEDKNLRTIPQGFRPTKKKKTGIKALK